MLERLRWGAVVVAMLLVLVVGVSACSGDDDEIAGGVSAGGIDVGGMGAGEAARAVRRAEPVVQRPLVVTFRDKRFELSPQLSRVALDAEATVQAAQDAGKDEAVAPRARYDRALVARWLGRLARRIDRDARDADIDFRDGKLERTRAQSGVRLRRAELARTVDARLTRPSARTSIAAPVTVEERPDRTISDLAERYPTVIAIDRDAKVLRLYKDLRLERRYKIAVGKQGTESSAGRYEIEEKIVDPPWRAPNKAWAGELAGQTIPAGDPSNPLEARWMGYHDGEGIHGTEDVASLGESASHGCIRMSVRAVKQLYEEVPKGAPLFLQ